MQMEEERMEEESSEGSGMKQRQRALAGLGKAVAGQTRQGIGCLGTLQGRSRVRRRAEKLQKRLLPPWECSWDHTLFFVTLSQSYPIATETAHQPPGPALCALHPQLRHRSSHRFAASGLFTAFRSLRSLQQRRGLVAD